VGALLDLVRARRQKHVELSDDLSDDEVLSALSKELPKILAELENDLERPVADGHSVTTAELEDLHAQCLDLLDQLDRIEQREKDAAAGIEHRCTAPVMVRPEPKIVPPPRQQASPAAQKLPRRRPAEPAPVDHLSGVKCGRILYWDSRGLCGVVDLAGIGEVRISSSATMAGGFTNFLVGQDVEFRIVRGQDRGMEVEPGTLRTARVRDQGGVEPAGLSGWEFARKRYGVG